MTVTYFYVICWFVKSCFEVLSWAFLSSWCHKSRRAGFNIRLHAHWVISCYWQLTVFWGLISQILHFETWYEQALQNTTFFNLIWPKMSEWGYKSSRNALTEVETEANRHLWDWKSLFFQPGKMLYTVYESQLHVFMFCSLVSSTLILMFMDN